MILILKYSPIKISIKYNTTASEGDEDNVLTHTEGIFLEFSLEKILLNFAIEHFILYLLINVSFNMEVCILIK